jgi:hypothetical protein
MTTLQIELPDELATQLQQEADRQGVRVTDLIQRAVQEIYSKSITLPGIEPGGRQTFEEAMNYTLEKNAELYRRLAQGGD